MDAMPVMLLRSLGINPDDIGKQVEAARKSAAEVVANFDGRLKAIEQNQDEMLKAMTVITDGISLVLKAAESNKRDIKIDANTDD